MVPPRGDAPRSPGYLPGALLLSYGGVERLFQVVSIIGGAPENRTLDAFAGRSGFQDRFLVYAGRAPFEIGSPAWTRTMTIGLTGRQAPLPHRGF